MTESYQVSCTCGAVGMTMDGPPKVRGHCHCQACRTLLNVPYHSVNAWEGEQVHFLSGEDHVRVYQHPVLTMTKVYCDACGDVLYNTNKLGWKVVSQHFMARNFGGKLPEDLASKSHFHYAGRVIDVDDDLPKRD